MAQHRRSDGVRVEAQPGAFARTPALRPLTFNNGMRQRQLKFVRAISPRRSVYMLRFTLIGDRRGVAVYSDQELDRAYSILNALLCRWVQAD